MDHGRPSDLNVDQQEKLTAVLARCPHLDAAFRHVGEFAKITLGPTEQGLDAWISTVEAELHSFRGPVERDHTAALNGLALHHSSGAVESNVNKLKACKRQPFAAPNSTCSVS